MPQKIYTVQIDGKTYDLEGDHPPSEAEARAAIGQQSQPSAAPAEKPDPFAAARSLAGGAPAGELWQRAKDNPVKTGAMIGSAAVTGGSAPLITGMLRAALGAAGGAGIGATVNAARGGENGPRTARGVAETMGTEGAIAAAGEGGGRAVVAGLSKAAPIVAKGVLRLAPSLQKEYGRDRIIQTFLNEGIPVGDAAEAGTRMSASAQEAKNMAAAAQQAGAAPVTHSEVTSEFGPLRSDIRDRFANARPGAVEEMRAVAERARGLRAQGPQDVVRNQELKQSAQRDANKAFRAQDRGAQINDTTAQLDKSVAIARQKAAETRIPGIADVNKRTQDLMGLEHALENAAEKSASPVGFNPVHWGGAMFPATSSKIAFGLNEASKLPFNDAFRTALLQMLGQGGSE